MVDIDAAIGYVVAKGDAVDRARLAYLRSGIAPSADILAKVEGGQTAEGGWQHRLDRRHLLSPC